MAPNYKWSQTIHNDPTYSKMIKYGLRMSEMALKGKKWSKNIQISVNWSQNVQCTLQWSSMVPIGPKWRKTKINHEFNRMAFITKFHLVLVWSKIGLA